MAGKNSGGKKKGASSGKGKPNWTPYVICLVAVLIGLAGYSVVYPQASAEDEEVEVKQPKAPQRPIAELEAQMRQLSQSLGSVASKGGSSVFQQIQAMADAATDVLTRSEAATTDSERRAILEAGLAAKSDWLKTMSDQTTRLRADEDAEQKEHAPLKIDSNGNVAILTKSTMTEYLRKHPRAMVEFYAPWCGHCKKLAPEYEYLAGKFKGRAGFAAIDGTAEEQLSRIFEVGGYPTLKWFVRGRPIDYSGPRTREKIGAWVEERLEPAYADIEETSDFSAAFEETNGDTAIIIGAGEKNSQLFQSFEAAAEQLRGQQLLFLWTPMESTDKDAVIKLHSRGNDPVPCAAQGMPICESGDDVIAWIKQARGISD